MRLQAAIDRVSVEDAEKIISEIGEYADIVEIGTSLIKDFGLAGSVNVLRKKFPEQGLLADIKTCDEGAYEFRKTYEAGADIATVMGFSSVSTIKACQEVAQEFNKEYMIDLLEVGDEKLVTLIREFPDAIFGVHLPADKNGDGLEALVTHEMEQLKGVDKVAVAGGVTLDTVDLMKRLGIDIVIVGGAITKAEDKRKAAENFAKKIRG